MLLYFDSPEGLDLAQLKQVYGESLEYGNLFTSAQDFYDYWLCDFFSSIGSACAVWEENGIYTSALRLESYRDGLLVTGLETLPEQRRQGIAGKLMSAVIMRLKRTGEIKLYSHIQRQNMPSVRVHKACGFSFVSDHAVFLDGSVSWNYDTFVLQI